MILNSCTVRGCADPPEAHGLCGTHVALLRKTGDQGGGVFGWLAAALHRYRSTPRPACGKPADGEPLSPREYLVLWAIKRDTAQHPVTEPSYGRERS